MIVLLAGAAAGVLLLIWCGAGLLAVSGITGKMDGLELASLSSLVGAGAFGVISLGLMLVGAPGSLWFSCILAGLAGVPSLKLLRRGTRESSLRRSRKWIDLALAMLLGVVVLKPLIELSLLPLAGWDTRIIWGFKAKVIQVEGSVLVPSFTDPYRIHLHPQYPLLMPTVQALFGSIAGGRTPGADDAPYRVPVVMAAFASLALLASAVLRSGGSRTAALIAALLLGCLPIYSSGLEVTLAEIFSGGYCLAAAWMLVRWLREGLDGYLWWAGAFGVFAGMSKMEGAAFLAASVAVVAVVRAIRIKLPPILPSRAALVPLALAVAGIGIGSLVKRQMPIVSTIDYAGILVSGDWTLSVAKLWLIAELVTRIAVAPGTWGVLFPLVVLCALWRAPREVRILAAIVGTYALAFVPVFVLSPWVPLEPHIRIALPRILLQISPVAMLVVAGRLVPELDRKGNAGS